MKDPKAMPGLFTRLIPSRCEKWQREYKQYWLKAGVLQGKNMDMPCACGFDEEDNLIDVCAAHEEWCQGRVKQAVEDAQAEWGKERSALNQKIRNKLL